MSVSSPSKGYIDDQRALVAVDLGAESCRVSLLRWLDGRPCITLIHRFPNAAMPSNGGLRWNLQRIEDGLDAGLRAAAVLAPEGIRSIAVDGWAVDYVRLDTSGRAIADPFCYRDERTVAAEASLHGRISPERMRELTGVQLSRINTLYQLYADPPELQGLPWLNLPEYILYRFGGRRVAELTNASHAQMLDLATRTWSREILAVAGIPFDTMPELVPAGTLVGKLKGALSQLPAFADTVLIAPATHDTASAIAGISAEGNDWAYLSSGTWSLVGTVLEAPCNEPGVHHANFTNLVAASGGILFHKALNGMWLVRQCLEHLESEGISWTIPELITAARLAPLPDALLDVSDPALMLPGNMPQHINRQRTLKNLPPLDENGRNASAFASLIFHSLAAAYAETLVQLARYTGKNLERLYVVGGGSQNAYLNELTEATTGLRVVRASAESSTLGNFAVQLATLHGMTAQTSCSDVARWAALLALSDSP